MSVVVIMGGVGLGQTLEEAIEKALAEVRQLPASPQRMLNAEQDDQDKEDADPELKAAAEGWLEMNFGGSTGPIAEVIRDRMAELAATAPSAPLSYMTTTQELGLQEGSDTGTAWSHARGAFRRRAHGRQLLIETGHPMRANQRGGVQQDTIYRFDPTAAAAVAAARARRQAPIS